MKSSIAAPFGKEFGVGRDIELCLRVGLDHDLLDLAVGATGRFRFGDDTALT